MVRKTRSDKKDTICKRCGHKCSTSQKLREHLKRKNSCKPLRKQKKVAYTIQTPIQVPIQKANQQAIQASEIKVQVKSSSVNMSNKKKPHVVIPTLVPELGPEKKVPGARLQKCWKELDLGVEPYEANDLDGCKTLFHNLELNDPEAVRPLTLKELESEGSSGLKTQSFRKGNKYKNLINKEFECLEEIKGHKRSEKDLKFKEQEESEIAVKRKAIAVYHAKVPKSHPDNGNDI
ncbi:unnamed protein product [Rhizophagus irregularis]|uniref:Uncharacterized protein n=1 Tax=Rhizophagus irregularis TaxID=588596 RepID=A0A2I1H0G0_9GLOM|nr:hypothetical protein RhiirA4_469985 [Rhizophagus irregularis]CAB4414109.1 unnamed protein product [Rhizophagus irregularis]